MLVLLLLALVVLLLALALVVLLLVLLLLVPLLVPALLPPALLFPAQLVPVYQVPLLALLRKLQAPHCQLQPRWRRRQLNGWRAAEQLAAAQRTRQPGCCASTVWQTLLASMMMCWTGAPAQHPQAL